MDNTHLVSVIIPCYKQAHYLPTAIESLLAQTYDTLEIIVINDGSPDNIGEVMQKYQADPRIRLIEQVNLGLSEARNTGLAAAKGEFLQFLDADDWLHPQKIAHQVAFLEKAEPQTGLVYCNFWPVYNDTEIKED